MMSTKTRRTIAWTTAICCIIMTCSLRGQSQEDVLDFYCNRARAIGDTRDPIRHGLDFSVNTKTYYKRIGGRGEVTQLDSALIEYFYSFGQLDSLKRDSSSTAGDFEFDLSYPNIFEQAYQFSFFPNDTGGEDLAIGFDADTSLQDQPVGLAIINRGGYFLHWLYLHYPYRENYRHYSRSYRFHMQDGFLFPDSIWVVASVDRILSREEFRIETGITKIKVNK